jgi:hypothetical protein
LTNVTAPGYNVTIQGYIAEATVAEKRLGQVDLNTGEVLEGFVAYLAPRQHNGFEGRWLAMAQEAARILAQHRKELGEEGFAVLFSLLARLDFENLLLLNQAEVARELGMHRQHVQRAIKRLIDLGALLEGPRVGINRSYRLNPKFGWKGSAKNHVKALDDYRAERLKAAGITGVVKGGEPTKPSRKRSR